MVSTPFTNRSVSHLRLGWWDGHRVGVSTPFTNRSASQPSYEMPLDVAIAVSTPFTNRSASQLIQIISLFGQSKVSTPFTNRSASQLYCLGHTRLGTHVSTPFTNRSASQQYLFFPVGNQSVIRSFPAHARYAAADIPPTPLESPISSIIPRPGAYASLFSLYSIDITGYFRIHLLGGADFFLAAGLIDFI